MGLAPRTSAPEQTILAAEAQFVPGKSVLRRKELEAQRLQKGDTV